MNKLDSIIERERSFGLETEKEIKRLTEEIVNMKKEKEVKTQALQSKINKLDEEYKVSYDITSTLSAMIPIEQLLISEEMRKSRLLEDTIQQMEDYLINLDRLFHAVSKSSFFERNRMLTLMLIFNKGKLDETDMKEFSLKKLIEGTKDDVSSSREIHKNSLVLLREFYDKSSELETKIEADLNSHVKYFL